MCVITDATQSWDMRCIVCHYFTGAVNLVSKARTATSALSVGEARRTGPSFSSGLAVRRADAGQCGDSEMMWTVSLSVVVLL